MPDTFASRHLGPRGEDIPRMLRVVGASSVDDLINQIVPPDIRLPRPLALPEADTEFGYFQRLRGIGGRNQVCRSYIGLGYHDTITPAVILRNVFENPGWYTPYTPYQAEIAQGRLESLLNYQTMVSELCGMEVANASLLDEATAAAEAMTMLVRVQKQSPARTFLVSNRVFPQVRAVLETRAAPLGILIRAADLEAADIGADVFGIYLQTPDDRGEVRDLRRLIDRAHTAGALVAVGTDLLALALMVPPGDMGADVVVGNAQRFGVPLGYGGPHAGFFATREAYVRQAPGRIIGVSVDSRGRPAYRMALQTREQHIRREKATSNICTAQALLANISAFYAVYHGPDGLKDIASRVHESTSSLAETLAAMGLVQTNTHYFDTIRLEADAPAVAKVREAAEARGLNFRYPEPGVIQIALNETVTEADLRDIVAAFGDALDAGAELQVPDPAMASISEPKAAPTSWRTRAATLVPGQGAPVAAPVSPAAEPRIAPPPALPASLRRQSPFLTHPVFNRHHSETEMMRYIRSLERKDMGLDTAMIPLGSCTMKLNAAAEMMPVSWPEFSRMHPFAPVEQAAGYQQVFTELEAALAEITGLPAVSLQPNSGAQGEFAGLLAIHAYHRATGQEHRDVVLIPQSAHGTNPASASMAGLSVVVVACDAQGNIDIPDLRAKATAHRERLSCLMVTYPSTHGVFEGGIREVCAIVHEHGGQVYMDGANMNAQVGLTSPAAIGADVCHLNLHKTFAIPHGGGGPGMGPIAVASHLAPYLPGNPIVPVHGKTDLPAVSAAPWGSASILLISYGYIRMLGAAGATAATKIAMLNANYLKSRLESHYPVLYAGRNGRVAHELIFDLRPFKQQGGVDEQDVAKRLMDYGFHAPTVSFPVAGTLMVEPTESEPLEELDRFCEAMISIRAEIQAVIDGTADAKDNVLKNAPHAAQDVAATEWAHSYSREQAAYPVRSLYDRKFWPPVSRIDNPYGDRNLMCACPPVETYTG